MGSEFPQAGFLSPAERPRMPRARRRSGNNIIEFSLLIPWYVFLFIGVFDFGFFSYSLIAVQSAARVGAEYASYSTTTQTDSTTACTYAIGQLQDLPNVGSGGTCTANSTTVTSAAPLAVQASAIASGPDTKPAASVTVTYMTPQLIPIPGLLPGKLTISRTVKMRIRT